MEVREQRRWKRRARGNVCQKLTEGPYGGKRKTHEEGVVNEVKGAMKRGRRFGKEFRGENNMSLVEAVRQLRQEL